MSDYPKTLEEFEKWSYDNPKDAVREAAGWNGTGQGYGDQAKIEWPECPGFDWDNDCPDYHDCELNDRHETHVEYRTVLTCDSPGPNELPGGWQREGAYEAISFEAYNIDTHENLGTVEVGGYESVYRREDMVCAECGGSTIEESAWINVNTGEVSEGDGPLDSYFCIDCDEECGIHLWSVWKSEQLKAAVVRSKERNPDSEEAKRKYHGT